MKQLCGLVKGSWARVSHITTLSNVNASGSKEDASFHLDITE